MIDIGQKYANRYKAVLNVANDSSLNIGELQLWAKKHKHPFDFSFLYKDDSIPLDRRYHSFEGLAWSMARQYELINIANGSFEYATTYEVQVDRLILCAIFDKELNLYHHESFIKIDIESYILSYEANPDDFLNDTTDNYSKVNANTNKPPAQPWWQKDYDILEKAKSHYLALTRKNSKPSIRKIAELISKDIETSERNKGKQRTVSADTIRNTALKGWKYKSD